MLNTNIEMYIVIRVTYENVMLSITPKDINEHQDTIEVAPHANASFLMFVYLCRLKNPFLIIDFDI